MIAKIMMTPGVATFANWTKVKRPSLVAYLHWIGVAMIAGFSFKGTEMVGVAAGESKDPQKRSDCHQTDFLAYSTVFMVCIFIIGTLISYDDPLLLQAASSENIALSHLPSSMKLGLPLLPA